MVILLEVFMTKNNDGNYYNDIFFIDIDTNEIKKELIIEVNGGVRYYAIEYDGQQLVCCASEIVHLINPDTGEISKNLKLNTG